MGLRYKGLQIVSAKINLVLGGEPLLQHFTALYLIEHAQVKDMLSGSILIKTSYSQWRWMTPCLNNLTNIN